LKVEFIGKGLKIFPKLERKGAYVKELDELDYDLPIVNEAIVKFLTDGISVNQTIMSCTELVKFQKVVKVSSSYLYGWHNDEFLSDKTFRVFASKSVKDSYIGKCKTEGATVEKFANTPEHCFIWNDSVRGIEVDERLDKGWYIKLTNERLSQFGFGRKSDVEEFGLF
jgi:hypothetical protein